MSAAETTLTLPRNFVILNTEKEGSSPIVDYLQRFEGVHVVGFEPFDRYRFHGHPMPNATLLTILALLFDKQACDGAEAAQRMAALYAPHCSLGIHHWPKQAQSAPRTLVVEHANANGVKMRFRPALQQELATLWKRTHTTVFVMYRADILKWALSKHRGGDPQFALAEGKTKRASFGAQLVNVKRLRALLSFCERKYAEKRALVRTLRTAGVNVHVLCYETFCADKETFFKALLGAVNVPISDTSLQHVLQQPSYFKKVHASRFRDLVQNEAKVRKAFPEYVARSERGELSHTNLPRLL